MKPFFCSKTSDILSFDQKISVLWLAGLEPLIKDSPNDIFDPCWYCPLIEGHTLLLYRWSQCVIYTTVWESFSWCYIAYKLPPFCFARQVITVSCVLVPFGRVCRTWHFLWCQVCMGELLAYAHISTIDWPWNVVPYIRNVVLHCTVGRIIRISHVYDKYNTCNCIL